MDGWMRRGRKKKEGGTEKEGQKGWEEERKKEGKGEEEERNGWEDEERKKKRWEGGKKGNNEENGEEHPLSLPQ